MIFNSLKYDACIISLALFQSKYQWLSWIIIRTFIYKGICVVHSPTNVFQTGSSGIFNSIICLRTSVWKVSTDKWIILFPLISVFLQLAPRENRYWIVSRAPEVAASNSGVHWFLKVKEHIMIIKHAYTAIFTSYKAIHIAFGGSLTYIIPFSSLNVISIYSTFKKISLLCLGCPYYLPQLSLPNYLSHLIIYLEVDDAQSS